MHSEESRGKETVWAAGLKTRFFKLLEVLWRCRMNHILKKITLLIAEYSHIPQEYFQLCDGSENVYKFRECWDFMLPNTGNLKFPLKRRKSI